jgi:hypothetical protein
MSVPSQMMRSPMQRPDSGAISGRMREWTRVRFTLAQDATIMVSEISCAVPGCPPTETVVVFWTDVGRHHFKIFKPLADIIEDDLPPAFMKNALAEIDGIDCACC